MANTKKPESFEVTRAEAAKILNCSRSQVQRYTERGILHSRQDPENGIHYYDIAHLESMKDRLNVGDTDQQAVLFEAQNALIEMALDHAKSTFKPVHDATHAAMTILKDENAALRARCNDLEKTHLELVQLLETLMSEKHARDLLTLEHTARIDRNKEIVSTLKTAIGPLSEQIKATLTARNAMTRFLTIVDKDKLRALLYSGLLSDDETSALKEMLLSAGIRVDNPEADSPSDTAKSEPEQPQKENPESIPLEALSDVDSE